MSIRYWLRAGTLAVALALSVPLAAQTITYSPGRVLTGDVTGGSSGAITLSVPGYGYGCTLSYSSGTVLGVAACYTAEDTSAAALMRQASAYTKTTGAWAVGTGNGGLDTGAVANSTWYFVYQIQRADTGVVDYLMTATYGSPTMPANYGRKRYIGPVKTDGAAAILSFTQTGNEFAWTAVGADIVAASIGTSASTLTFPSVPNGYKVLANLRAETFKAAASPIILLSSLDATDVAANSPEGNTTITSVVAASGAVAQTRLPTNTAQQIRARSNLAASSVWVNVVGWTDPQIAWPH